MIQDLLYVTFAFFMVAIMLVVGYVIWDSINTGIQDSPIPAAQKTFFSEQKDYYQNTWDYVFLTIIVGVLIGLLVLSYVVPSNPVMFIAILILVIITAGVSGYISNAFGEVILDTVLGDAAAKFPITTFIMEHYVIFILVTGFLMSIVFFAKPSEASY